MILPLSDVSGFHNFVYALYVILCVKVKVVTVSNKAPIYAGVWIRKALAPLNSIVAPHKIECSVSSPGPFSYRENAEHDECRPIKHHSQSDRHEYYFLARTAILLHITSTQLP